jgi:hypothetical protein
MTGTRLAEHVAGWAPWPLVSRRQLYARASEATIRAVAAEHAAGYHLLAMRDLVGPQNDEAGQ